MINLKFENQVLKIPTDVYEFSIELFEKLFMILQDQEMKLFDKWIKIFILVGIPIELINNLDQDEFNEIVKEFKFDLELTKIKSKIEIDKIEYKAYEKEFDISVKDFILIQNYLSLNPLNNITKVLAILYKSKDELKNKPEFSRIYIEEKALKFKTVKANYAIPVYNLLNNLLLIQRSNA